MYRLFHKETGAEMFVGQVVPTYRGLQVKILDIDYCKVRIEFQHKGMFFDRGKIEEFYPTILNAIVIWKPVDASEPTSGSVATNPE